MNKIILFISLVQMEWSVSIIYSIFILYGYVKMILPFSGCFILLNKKQNWIIAVGEEDNSHLTNEILCSE